MASKRHIEILTVLSISTTALTCDEISQKCHGYASKSTMRYLTKQGIVQSQLRQDVGGANLPNLYRLTPKGVETLKEYNKKSNTAKIKIRRKEEEMLNKRRKEEMLNKRRKEEEMLNKPWKDPDSLFCDTEFLEELLGKPVTKGKLCKDERRAGKEHN